MSLKNLLDLRKKAQPQIKIVERIILQKRSLKSDILLAFSVILVATSIVWSISKADTKDQSVNTQTVSIQGFSAIGTVSDITTSTLSITNTKSSDKTGNTEYTFDTTNILKIETKNYVPLSLSDLKVGDKIIVQGLYENNQIQIRRVVSFGLETLKLNTATTTATTTEDIGTTSTSTNATSTNLIDTIKDAVSNTISDVVDAIVGTSTGTSTNTESTSTATTTEATTTPQTDSTTSNPEATTTIIDSIKDVVSNVVNSITGTDTNPTPPQATATDTPTPLVPPTDPTPTN